MRSDFEKLPEIIDSLNENIVFIGNRYCTENDGLFDLVNWLNGAWYAFQHRQTEVDGLKKENLLLESGQKSLFKQHVELQKRVDAALQEISGATRWVDEDAIDDPEFIKGGVLRAFARLEQALKGGEA